MKFKDIIKKYSWINTLFWIVITAIITLLIEKSCDRIVPDSPVIIKEVSDTIKIVHSYDFGILNDSLTNVQLQSKLRNIELVEKYEEKVVKRIKEEQIPNSIKQYPFSSEIKGYIHCDATPYFILDTSSLQEKYIDFEYFFFDENVLTQIYCLSLKIHRINNERRTVILDENYIVNKKRNILRIANTLPKGTLEISVGFTFKKDKDKSYPPFYQITKIINR